MKFQDNLVVNERLLMELFFDSLENKKQLSPPEIVARDYFSDDQSSLDKAIEFLQADGEPLNPFEGIQTYRQLITLCLMTTDKEGCDEQRKQLKHLIQKSCQLPFWKEFQLAGALKNLLCHFVGLPLEPFKPKQFEGGAVPHEWGGHWSWAESPHNLFHAELGIYWSMLGYLTDNPTLLEAANTLADWQLNLLDHDYIPYPGLFAQESEGGLRQLLPFYYVLFLASTTLGKQHQYQHIVEILRETLKIEFRQKPFEIPLHLIFIEEWITSRYQKIESVHQDFPRNIYDPSVALVGLRQEKMSVVCTHFGGRTGLGAFHTDDVQILTYGPQHYPIGDCENFGIEGGQHSKNAYPYAEIQCDVNTFSIKSHIKVASKIDNQNSWALYKIGKHSQIWAEIYQYFENRTLRIQFQFFSTEKTIPLAFSFFIKAKRCKVGDFLDLKPCTLERYEGNCELLRFSGETSSLNVNFKDYQGNIQVIPLAGGDNFWGADFMLSVMNPGHDRVSISITY